MTAAFASLAAERPGRDGVVVLPAPRRLQWRSVVVLPDDGPLETAREGQLQVVLAGVLANRAALADLLRPAGDGRPPDADLALRAYRRLGIAALEELRGRFALVVSDGASDTVLCVRDPLGFSPLFYMAQAEELVVSTSLEALVRHSRVVCDLNRAALADHLAHRWPDPEETFYEGVRRVPPGHALRVSAAGRELFRYWRPAPRTSADWVAEDELDRFDGLLDEAVARSLERGRAGIYLSGGLDSVTVAAVAADTSRASGLAAPHALSVVFPHPDCNEEDAQRSVAARLGLSHRLVPLGDAAGPEGLLRAALEISARSPAPLMNVWTPAYRVLASEARREGCEVILTGAGGDEWLTVSPFLAADLLRAGDLAGFYRLWRSMQRSYRLSRRALGRNLLWTFGTRPLLVALAQKQAPSTLRAYRRRRRARSTPAWLAPGQDLRREVDARAEASAFADAENGFYLREGQLSLDHTLVAMEMEEIYEEGRTTGIPVQMPFWDADLVGFLYRTPPDLLNRGGATKGLVRAMLDRRFPDLGFGEHRKVFATSFFRSLLLEEGPGAWRRLGGAKALGELGVVEPRLLDERVDQIFSDRKPGLHHVWDVLTLEAWVRSRLSIGGKGGEATG
jgi:asparagine synthase (glutamine-hydrolysing)